MASTTDRLLVATGIDKAFPGVQALRQVDFDLRAGEVHALVGENGAGKSTLTRIIAGVETPDAGQMLLAGRPYEPKSRIDAEGQGVRMVMQELNLIGNLTVAENIFIERLPSRLRIHPLRQAAPGRTGGDGEGRPGRTGPVPRPSGRSASAASRWSRSRRGCPAGAGSWPSMSPPPR